MFELIEGASDKSPEFAEGTIFSLTDLAQWEPDYFDGRCFKRKDNSGVSASRNSGISTSSLCEFNFVEFRMSYLVDSLENS